VQSRTARRWGAPTGRQRTALSIRVVAAFVPIAAAFVEAGVPSSAILLCLDLVDRTPASAAH
jgi:hypothetical protein